MFKPVFAFHPGEDIWEELEARGWTQRQFADIIGISAPELNNIIKGKKNLTPALAVRSGEAFGTSAEVWMNMQVHYSLDLAKKEEIKRIERVHEKLKEYGFEDLAKLDDETIEKVLLKKEKKPEQKQVIFA